MIEKKVRWHSHVVSEDTERFTRFRAEGQMIDGRHFLSVKLFDEIMNFDLIFFVC